MGVIVKGKTDYGVKYPQFRSRVYKAQETARKRSVRLFF